MTNQLVLDLSLVCGNGCTLIKNHPGRHQGENGKRWSVKGNGEVKA